MKYSCVLLAVLLLVGVSSFPLNFNNDDDEQLNDLDKDFIDFYKLLRPEDLERVLQDHVSDPEFWKDIQYLMSDDFHKLLYTAEDLPEFHKYVLYLQAAGYNIIRDLKLFHRNFRMKEYVPPEHVTQEVMKNLKKGGGLNGYIDDLISILPKEKIQELHAKKVKESPAFAKYSTAIMSPKFADLSFALYIQKPMQALLQQAKANGFDFIKFNSFKYQLTGFLH